MASLQWKKPLIGNGPSTTSNEVCPPKTWTLYHCSLPKHQAFRLGSLSSDSSVGKIHNRHFHLEIMSLPRRTKRAISGLGTAAWVCESESPSVVSDSLWPQGLYSPWNSPGQNTGVGRLSLLQGIFPTQGSNPGLLHCRQILYQLSYYFHLTRTRVLRMPYPPNILARQCISFYLHTIVVM